jgi:hypothetical protein
MRYMVLYKYGGVYLDADVSVLQRPTDVLCAAASGSAPVVLHAQQLHAATSPAAASAAARFLSSGCLPNTSSLSPGCSPKLRPAVMVVQLHPTQIGSGRAWVAEPGIHCNCSLDVCPVLTCAGGVLYEHGAIAAGQGPCAELRRAGCMGTAAQRCHGQHSRTPLLASCPARSDAALSCGSSCQQWLGAAAYLEALAPHTILRWFAGCAAHHRTHTPNGCLQGEGSCSERLCYAHATGRCARGGAPSTLCASSVEQPVRRLA